MRKLPGISGRKYLTMYIDDPIDAVACCEFAALMISNARPAFFETADAAMESVTCYGGQSETAEEDKPEV